MHLRGRVTKTLVSPLTPVTPQEIQTHKASRIRLIRSNFAVDFHQSLVDNFLHFVVRQSVLETVAQKHSKW